MRCAACQHTNPAAAKLCHEGGMRAGAAAAPAEAAPAASRVGAHVAGRYEIKRLLGEGARKRVHLAWDARLGDPPDVATLHDIGEEDGAIYIAQLLPTRG